MKNGARPADGLYDLEELAELGFVSARTVRRYMALGILPKVPFRGPAKKYGREHLLRLRAIHRLEDEVGRDASRIQVQQMTLAEVEAYLAPPAPPKSADAPPATTAAPAGERWAREQLVPGLELFVKEGSGELVERLAAEIRERYAAK